MENNEETGKGRKIISATEILGRLGSRTNAIDECVEGLITENPRLVELKMDYAVGSNELLAGILLASRKVGFSIRSDKETYNVALMMFHDNIEGSPDAYRFVAKPSNTVSYHRNK